MFVAGWHSTRGRQDTSPSFPPLNRSGCIVPYDVVLVFQHGCDHVQQSGIVSLGDREHGSSANRPLFVGTGSGQSRVDSRIAIRGKFFRRGRPYRPIVALAHSFEYLVRGPAERREADHHEPIACLDQSKKAEDRPQNRGDGGKRFERQWHGWNKAGTGRYRLPLRLRGYFVVGGIGPPPPPMVRAYIVRPPFRFLGNLRSRTRSVYYANTVYVNSVDTNRSRLEHSWSGQYPSKFASGVGATYSGVACSAGIFSGILRRQVRRTSDIHGYRRAR